MPAPALGTDRPGHLLERLGREDRPHLPVAGLVPANARDRPDLREEPRVVGVDGEAPEVEALRVVLDRYMPGAAGTVTGVSTCLYTNPPDRHFIVDRHPTHPQLYACGFSGHGFKFASVMGEALADLALDGATHHPIGFLSAARFAAPASGLR